MANAKEKVQKRLSWVFHISLRIHETYKRTCKLSTFMTWIACDRVHKKIENEIWILPLLFVNKNILVHLMIKYF